MSLFCPPLHVNISVLLTIIRQQCSHCELFRSPFSYISNYNLNRLKSNKKDGIAHNPILNDLLTILIQHPVQA